MQETFLELAERMPEFEYNRSRGSFKAWLMQLTRWRIIDFARKRRRRRNPGAAPTATSAGTETVHNVPDPAFDFEKAWHDEWQTNLLHAAMARIRATADPERFQIYDLYVNKSWPPERIATAFGIRTGQVYLIKNRINTLLKAEVKRLQERLE